jgi:hypothetical protein
VVQGAFVLLLMLLVPQAGGQETPKPPPKDSTQLVVTGCLKGRVLTPAELPDTERRGPDVSGKTFRLAGPRPVIDEVKKHDRHFVEVTGYVKVNALAPEPPGVKVGGTRVKIGAPPYGSDPTHMDPRYDPMLYSVVVMDATAVRFLSSACPIKTN